MRSNALNGILAASSRIFSDGHNPYALRARAWTTRYPIAKAQ